LSLLGPLAVATALLGAAAALSLSVLRPPRIVLDALATSCAAVVLGLTTSLLVASGRGPVISWFGGWLPRRGIALGVDFAVDPLGAGMAALAAALTLAALVFIWRALDHAHGLLHALLLVFLAAMVGLALTGDLFDLFVFFELMSVCAYALTAFRIEDQGPLQGALVFAVTNTVGAFLVLTGIALLYGRTGTLNLVQLGMTLHRHPHPEGLVVVAFASIAAGLLVKAGVAPFHFWVADAETVAPTPVCALFSGVLAPLGLYALARITWTVFLPALGPRASIITWPLLAMGTASVVIGSLMCWWQRNLKRQLAFSTVAHSGLILLGVALLRPVGLAGAAVYLLGYGLIKGSLFLSVGALMHRFGGRVDEDALCGQGRGLRGLGVLTALGGLGLAGLPPFAAFVGKSMIDRGANGPALVLVAAAAVLGSVVTGATVLRVAARVYLGLGRQPTGAVHRHGSRRPGEAEPEGRSGPVPLTMLVPVGGLLLAAAVAGVAAPVRSGAARAAAAVAQPVAMAQLVLDGRPMTAPAITVAAPDAADWVLGLGSAAAAVALAGAGLAAAAPTRARGSRRLRNGLRSLHSGHPGDYVTWIVVGTAALGGVLGLGLR